MRFLLALFAGLAVACAAHAQTPQEKAAAKEAAVMKQYPPPGRMVDVGGGRRLHLFCKGRGPTVLIEAGGVASSLYYWTAQDEIAKSARACVYDRAGLGWSDPAPLPRTLSDRAEDLHALIRRGGLKRPVVLVGHSMGGLIAQVYAKTYPKDLAGLVLVESSDFTFNGLPEHAQRTARTAQQMGLAIQAASVGMDVPALRVPNGPPEQAVALRASVFRAGQDDLVIMSKVREEEARIGPVASLGDLPLVVIRRGKPEAGFTAEQNAGWAATQERLARLSTRGSLVVAERSGHNVHADQPALYGDAVRQVLAARRR